MLSVLVLVLAIASYSQIEASPKDRNDYNLNNKLKPHSDGSKLSLDRYYTYEEMVKYIESLAQRYPKRAKVSSIGESYEKRELKTITITNGDGREEKKVILIDAGFHGREWITPAAALYLIEQLVENYSENEELLADYDWVVLPSVNPDGYIYSRTVNKFWRGSRQPAYSFNCSEEGKEPFIGVELNSNFDIHFAEGRLNCVPCGHAYPGPYPFSELETRAVRDLMHKLKDRAKMYVTLHAFGNVILYPSSYSKTEIPENIDELKEIASAAVKAIKEKTGKTFEAQFASSYDGVGGGTSTDYAYSIGIPTVFAFELSPTNVTEFEEYSHKKLPAESINELDAFFPPETAIAAYVKEAWFGIRTMAQQVIKKY